MYPQVLLHIAGAWRPAAAGETHPVVDPATEEEIGTHPVARQADLDDALAAAERGFALWRATSAFERARTLRRAADLLRERAPEIARVMTLEQGKPLAEATGETRAGADIIEWFAGEAQRAYGRVIPARAPNVTQLSLREPVGPVACFTPWNFPINQAVRKLSAALATGCSVVLKGPEDTPASCAALVRCFLDGGVPADVLSLVYGDPKEISDYLIPHPVIRKVSFTGSTQIGKQLAALAGLHMKRITMELGGHAPALVFRDADVDLAVKVLGGTKFRNAGQVCIAPTRILAEGPVFDAVVAGFAQAAERQTLGHGLEEGVTMGPLAHARRLPAVSALVEDAVARGARLVTGGQRHGNKGYFYAPTVLADVPRDARIMNEEPFGPVAIVNRIDGADALLAEANRLPYGLAAYGYTGSQVSADRMSSELEAGMVSINHHGIALPELPFGGVKDSGYGSEGGAEAIESYLSVKLVTRAAL
ncbi:NAD-dependent succinate-semialdehyde dehydrogenase [Acidimangrovimonas sediminis]|uniref:NAD-dependent succinate-semialdehyde dehydrogenase n=1 Tax=Acidimangrovimonas sediminis TaxID=2056283 RepID=UPI000C7F95EF|nr:NAD-dependent succinate-semialdehyde dehydrogenase [Acidimangrovimonas sediminis]